LKIFQLFFLKIYSVITRSDLTAKTEVGSGDTDLTGDRAVRSFVRVTIPSYHAFQATTWRNT